MSLAEVFFAVRSADPARTNPHAARGGPGWVNRGGAMNLTRCHKVVGICLALGIWILLVAPVHAQLIDNTQATNTVNAGVNKSLSQEIGKGRGSVTTPDSSLFIIARPQFRAIRRGRQLFQRKVAVAQGQGPGVGDGFGNIDTTLAIGAGLADSCALCHGRPRGSAGSGGDVATRPDSRDAPHLFGLGLVEMLGDEITSDLRAIRDKALRLAVSTGSAVKLPLESKGIRYGFIRALCRTV